MREQWGGIQPMQSSTNAPQDSHADGIMVQIKSQEDVKECKMKKENYEWITHTFEKMESRLKSIEDDKVFTKRKENRE